MLSTVVKARVEDRSERVHNKIVRGVRGREDFSRQKERENSRNSIKKAKSKRERNSQNNNRIPFLSFPFLSFPFLSMSNTFLIHSDRFNFIKVIQRL